MNKIPESELIINKDGSVYHLGLLPEQLCQKVITVGDPDRVDVVAQRLDRIYYKHRVREFCTIGGELNGKSIMIVSTGIGTDNIDIVINELDALANIDLENRTRKDAHQSLEIFRIGTSGSLRKEISIDTYVISEYAIGLDSLLHYYKRNQTQELIELQQSFNATISKLIPNVNGYAVKNSNGEFINSLPNEFVRGCTLTAPGFYGPQGRELNGRLTNKYYLDELRKFQHKGIIITNFEMETAGIYGMAEILGHKAVSLNAIIANREVNQFSSSPLDLINRLIDISLQYVTA